MHFYNWVPRTRRPNNLWRGIECARIRTSSMYFWSIHWSPFSQLKHQLTQTKISNVTGIYQYDRVTYFNNSFNWMLPVFIMQGSVGFECPGEKNVYCGFVYIHVSESNIQVRIQILVFRKGYFRKWTMPDYCLLTFVKYTPELFPRPQYSHWMGLSIPVKT